MYTHQDRPRAMSIACVHTHTYNAQCDAMRITRSQGIKKERKARTKKVTTAAKSKIIKSTASRNAVDETSILESSEIVTANYSARI